MGDRHQAQAYPLRLPQELKHAVAQSAEANGRSLNAEIVDLLQRALGREGDREVVLDQARQIWKLRSDLAVASIMMARAIFELERLGLKDKKVLAQYQEVVRSGAPHAQTIIDMDAETLAREKARLFGAVK